VTLGTTLAHVLCRGTVASGRRFQVVTLSESAPRGARVSPAHASAHAGIGDARQGTCKRGCRSLRWRHWPAESARGPPPRPPAGRCHCVPLPPATGSDAESGSGSGPCSWAGGALALASVSGARGRYTARWQAPSPLPGSELGRCHGAPHASGPAARGGGSLPVCAGPGPGHWHRGPRSSSLRVLKARRVRLQVPPSHGSEVHAPGPGPPSGPSR
jgi:hypothetical protein